MRREPQQLCQARDGPPVVAIGRGDQRQRLKRRELRLQIGEGMPRFDGATHPLLKRAVNRPGRAQKLKGGKAKPARFIFHPDVTYAKRRRDARGVDQRRWLVAWELLMEVERFGAREIVVEGHRGLRVGKDLRVTSHSPHSSPSLSYSRSNAKSARRCPPSLADVDGRRRVSRRRGAASGRPFRDWPGAPGRARSAVVGVSPCRSR